MVIDDQSVVRQGFVALINTVADMEVIAEGINGQQAIDLYNEIIAKPSDTVTAGTAQLDLADLYAATGKQEQARALWAKLKDSDKDGAAGSIAAQKLSGKQ